MQGNILTKSSAIFFSSNKHQLAVDWIFVSQSSINTDLYNFFYRQRTRRVLPFSSIQTDIKQEYHYVFISKKKKNYSFGLFKCSRINLEFQHFFGLNKIPTKRITLFFYSDKYQHIFTHLFYSNRYHYFSTFLSYSNRYQ